MRSALRLARLGAAATALSVALALPAHGQTSSPTVIRLDLSGVVDPFVADYVRSGIEAAEEEGAAAVLLTIDTPGGLDSSMREIVQAVLNTSVPVVCYVSPDGARAASAGTFVLLSCPIAAMAPATNVGAAHPVGISGAILSEKAENDAAKYIVGLAELRGRNAEWAERAVRESVSASAEEALELGVIDLVAPSVPDLFRSIDGRTVEVAGGREAVLDLTGATIVERHLGVGVGILHAMLNPNLAFIFFWLGAALIALELFVPGGVVGTVGAIMLVLAVVAFGMLPVQLIGVVFLLASVVFFILELKHPGLGVPTIGGLVTIVLGGLFLFDRSVPSAQVSPLVIAPVAAAVTLFSAFVVRTAIKLRHKPVVSGIQTMVGREGMVVKPLEPAGVVQVAAEEWSAESVAGNIDKGARIRVVSADGLRLKVEPVRERAPAAPGNGEGRTA